MMFQDKHHSNDSLTSAFNLNEINLPVWENKGYKGKVRKDFGENRGQKWNGYIAYFDSSTNHKKFRAGRLNHQSKHLPSLTEKMPD